MPAASPSAPGPDPNPDQEPDHEAVARKILLDQLTGQARSRADLAGKLARKSVPEPIAERLLDRFEEVGLVDDAAFARSWVQSRQSGKGLARRALALELRRKGVSDDDARAALDEVDPDQETEAARRLVQRKLRSLQRVDRTTATRRLVGMLGRKGYPPGMALSVVREELDACDDGSAAATEPDDGYLP
jgi:regulatory protein